MPKLALNLFLSSYAIYFCETPFSTLIIIKSKHGQILKSIEDTPHPAVSNSHLRFDFNIKISKYIYLVSIEMF